MYIFIFTFTSKYLLVLLELEAAGSSDLIGEAVGDESGDYVALAVNGMNLVIGAPGANHNDDRRRYVKVYHREGNELSWKQLGPDINGETDGELFGNLWLSL